MKLPKKKTNKWLKPTISIYSRIVTETGTKTGEENQGNTTGSMM